MRDNIYQAVNHDRDGVYVTGSRSKVKKIIFYFSSA